MVMMLMFFMMMSVKMFVAFGCDHRIRFFLFRKSSDLFFNSLALIMIAFILQAVIHEGKRYIRDSFNLCDLRFKLRCTICAINSGDFKFIQCLFMF